jgi:hypothetical protein
MTIVNTSFFSSFAFCISRLASLPSDRMGKNKKRFPWQRPECFIELTRFRSPPPQPKTQIGQSKSHGKKKLGAEARSEKNIPKSICIFIQAAICIFTPPLHSVFIILL